MWYFIFFSLLTASSQGSHLSPTYQSSIDLLINTLKQEQWEVTEMPCLKKTIAILENVKNSSLWATWVLNANAIPSGNLYGTWVQLGHYDQCINPPWLHTHPEFRTQHCIADVSLSDKLKKINPYVDPHMRTQEYLNQYTVTGIPLNRLIWGVCVPAVCQPHSIAKITRMMYQITNFGTASPNITVEHCQVAGMKQSYTTGLYLFMLLIATLVVIAVTSTYYRKYYTTDTQPSDSLESIITKSFCIITNHQDLMKVNKEEIKVMNGMRFITATAIVLLHEMFFSVLSGITNLRDYEQDLDGISRMFLHLDVLVDTFLLMSGLLYIRGLLANVNRQKNLFIVLWKRYLRLIGPFAITIFYIATVAPFTGSGPLWLRNYQSETDMCLKNWKLSMLMLNTDPKDLCHGVTWYISCDYQLAVLGTILFYFYQRNKKLGLYVFGTAFLFSIIIPAGLTYWYRLPGIHFMNKMQVVYYIRQYWESALTYMSSYGRAGAYLVGIAMGYLMTTYKPADYRNTISKKWSIIITAISVATMLFILSLGGIYLEREYNPVEAAIVAATNRIVWAIAVCCIIGCCEYGNVPLVNSFLSSPFFTPLSRLSYGLYIIHPILIMTHRFSMRSAIRFDKVVVMKDMVGTLVVSTTLSYVMWLLVEAPMMKLSTQLLIKMSSPTKAAKTNLKTNGIQNGHIKPKVS